MSVRRVIPAAFLAVLALSAVGCAAESSDAEDNDSTEAPGASEHAGAGDETAAPGQGGSRAGHGPSRPGKNGNRAPGAGEKTDGDEAPGTNEAPGSSAAGGAAFEQVPISSALPTGVADANGIVTFVVGRNEELPLVFHAAESVVKEIANGFEVRGDLTLDTAAGPLTLASAEIVFEWTADHKSIERFSGTVEVPAPGLGALEGFATVGAPVRATIAWDLGKNLKAKLDAPMLDHRKYLAFDYSVGASASAGPVSFSAPGGKGGTLVLDPRDPSFFMTGGLLGLDAVGPLSDMALGLSARGLLPFEPANTWGVEDEAKGLTGHVYGKGRVNLTKIPVTIDGELVVNVDPTGKGRLIGSGLPEGVELGANGQVNLTVDFAKFFTFEVPLAKGTLGARITNAHQHAYVSGEVGPDADWMPSPLPFIPQSKARVAAFVDSDIAKSKLRAEADYTFKANKLYSLVPGMPQLGLRDIPVAKGTFSADRTGVRVTGTATTPIIPVLQPKAGLTVDAFFPSTQPEAFYMSMNGELSFADFPLGSASARIDKNGMRANGLFSTPISQIAMAGSVTSSGATLEGKVTVDLRGAKQVAQTITDGAVCGYDYVRDGTLCGYETVRDGALCGTRTVRDAAICGTQYVTDAGQCGTEVITDGAICGWNVLKSAWDCAASGFTNCKSPKTCSVARSCNVARSCSVANTCEVGKTCAKAKTCETKVDVPDFDFGQLQGTLRVTAQSSKATAQVSGSVCTAGKCTPVGSARVELGASPRACVSGLPGALGEVCGRF